jgi:hypothetical protein
MVASQRTNIPVQLRTLFPTRWLNATAHQVGLVERRRKVAPAAFFWSVVLGFGTGQRRTRSGRIGQVSYVTSPRS